MSSKAVIDDATTRNVGLHDDSSTDLFALDRIRSATLIDSGDRFQRDGATVAERHSQSPKPRFVFAKTFVQSDHQVERPLAVDHLRNDSSVHRRFNVFIDVSRRDAVLGKSHSVNFDPQLIAQVRPQTGHEYLAVRIRSPDFDIFGIDAHAFEITDLDHRERVIDLSG